MYVAGFHKYIHQIWLESIPAKNADMKYLDEKGIFSDEIFNEKTYFFSVFAEMKCIICF